MNEVPTPQAEDDGIKQTADHLGISVEEVMRISIEVINSGTPAYVETVDGETTVTEIPEASIVPKP